MSLSAKLEVPNCLIMAYMTNTLGRSRIMIFYQYRAFSILTPYSVILKYPNQQVRLAGHLVILALSNTLDL